MKKRLLVLLIVGLCIFNLASCGTNYEEKVQKAFSADCVTQVMTTRLQLEEAIGESVSATPPTSLDQIHVTTIKEGEEYTAEGDIEYDTASSGSVTQRCVGTYVIDENGEAKNTNWYTEKK